jgi:hypothetical protein
LRTLRELKLLKYFAEQCENEVGAVRDGMGAC